MNKGNLTILLVDGYRACFEPAAWQRAITQRIPLVDVHVWPDTVDPAAVDVVVLDRDAPFGLFGRMTGLSVVAGPADLLDRIPPAELPERVRIVRFEPSDVTELQPVELGPRIAAMPHVANNWIASRTELIAGLCVSIRFGIDPCG